MFVQTPRSKSPTRKSSGSQSPFGLTIGSITKRNGENDHEEKKDVLRRGKRDDAIFKEFTDYVNKINNNLGSEISTSTTMVEDRRFFEIHHHEKLEDYLKIKIKYINVNAVPGWFRNHIEKFANGVTITSNISTPGIDEVLIPLTSADLKYISRKDVFWSIIYIFMWILILLFTYLVNILLLADE